MSRCKETAFRTFDDSYAGGYQLADSHIMSQSKVLEQKVERRKEGDKRRPRGVD